MVFWIKKKRTEKSNYSKKLTIVAVFFLFTMSLLLLALPTIISTEWGQKQFFSLINNQIIGEVNAKRVSFSWFGEQAFEEVVLKDQNGMSILTLEKLETKESLLSLWYYGARQGSLNIASLNAIVVEVLPGLTNIEMALSQKKTTPVVNSLENSQKNRAITLKDVNAFIDIPEFPQKMTAYISGFTEQGDSPGQFEVNVALTGCDPSSMFCITQDSNQLIPLNEDAELTLKVNTVNFPIDLLDQIVLDQEEETYPALIGIVRNALGDKLDLRIDQSITSEGILFEVIAKSPNLSLDLAGYLESDQLVFHRPGKMSLKVQPEFIKHLTEFLSISSPMQLKHETRMDAVIEQLTLPLSLSQEGVKIINLSDLAMQTRVTVASLELEGTAGSKGAVFRDINATLQTDVNSKTAAISLSGEANHEGGAPVKIRVNATIDKPTTFKGLLESVGKQTNVKIELEGAPAAFVDEFLGLDQTLVNAFGESSFLKIETVSNPEKTDFKMQFNSDRLQISDLRLQLNRINGHGVVLEDLLFSESFDDVLTKVENIDPKLLSLNLKATSNQLPIVSLCQAFCQDQSYSKKIEALLGRVVDGDIRLNVERMNGPIYMNLYGTTGHYQIDAQLIGDLISLNSPCLIEIAFTPELNQEILQKSFSILGEVVSSENLLKLVIDSKNTVFPLKDLNLRNIQINSAVIELGKMHFKGNGEIRSALEFFKSDPNEDLTIWFTPLYFDMHDGTIRVQRMDMLLMNRYPLAVWGRIDLARDKLNMVIGLSGQALSNALKINGLDKNYMLQIPLKGPIANASIDKRKATSRITALVAQHQGGPPGFIIGTFLKIASGSLGEERSPSPTTSPFPWEV